MPEWPVASVQSSAIADPELWEAAAHDPKLYVLALRMRGDLTPPWGGGVRVNTLRVPVGAATDLFSR